MGTSLSRGRQKETLLDLPLMPFDQFLNMLGSSTVSKVIFQPDGFLEVVTSTSQRLVTRMIRGLSTEWLVQRLVETRTPFIEGRKPPSALARSIRGSMVIILPVLYLYLAYVMMKRLTDDSSQSLVEQRKKRRQGSSVSTPVSWAHVAGMDAARRELQEVVEFLTDPGKFRRLGARCPRGVLLSGPPGCGKTLLARAAAHEAGVNIIVCSASDFVEVFVGRGSARVRDLFQRADACAPCILFFDELDALAKSRTSGGFGNDEREQTLNQLLTEMDGFDSSMWDGSGEGSGSRQDKGSSGGGPVVVIGATNRPDVLDTALVRPGRFDRHVRVELPDEAGRLDILNVHMRLRKVPVQGKAPLEEIARATVGFSGADLGNVVNEACLLAVRANRDVVTAEDFRAAAKKTSEMRSLQTATSFMM